MATTADQPSRRRQRSVRVVTAVVLLAVAGLAVIGAVVSGTWVVLALAAIVATALGMVATRIVHSELADTRRDAARDRAELARDYHDLQVLRSAENEQFVVSMNRRFVEAHQLASDLEKRLDECRAELADSRDELADTRKRLKKAIDRADASEDDGVRLGRELEEAKARAATAEMRVTELELELEQIAASQPVVEDYRKRA